MEAVSAIVCDQGGRPLSVREGEFQVEGVPVKMIRVLFDTGALHKSYVSAELVEKFRDSWKESIFPHRAVACLAHPAILPERNRDRLFAEFAARV